MGNSYKRQETQAQTLSYKHTHNPHLNPDATPMKKTGDHMSTNAKRNTIHRAQCFAPNVTNLSPTHTLWEDANTNPDYAHLDITSHSNCYMNNWKNTMEGDGRQSVWT